MQVRIAAALFLLALCTTNAQAQTFIVLDIPSIPGDSTLAGYEDTINVLTWSQSVANVGNMPVVLPLEIAHELDVATPKLIEAALLGSDLGTVKMTLVASFGGGTLEPFYQLTLNQTKVVAVKSGGDSSAVPVETVTMTCSNFSVSYREAQPDGTFDEPVVFNGSCGN